MKNLLAATLITLTMNVSAQSIPVAYEDAEYVQKELKIGNDLSILKDKNVKLRTQIKGLRDQSKANRLEIKALRAELKKVKTAHKAKKKVAKEAAKAAKKAAKASKKA